MKKYLALKASAGSGKTFALTVRYITLLLLGAKPNEILTLTFTNKAANEMSERIYKTLLTLGDDEAYLNAIIEQSGITKQEILGRKGFLVKSFSSATLSIFTIDKFINKNLSITLIATLGGGVGSGSTKAIAEHLSNKNIIVNCILVKPFSWEGSKKINRANETIEFLKQLKNVSIIEIENDELKSFEHLSMKESFNLLNNKINFLI